MDLNLPDMQGFEAIEQIMEHQRTVKLGKKRETKKKMLNNYLLSIKGSPRDMLSMKSRSKKKRGERQIIIEQTSSIGTDKESEDEEEGGESSCEEYDQESYDHINDFSMSPADSKLVREIVNADPD